MTCDIRWAASSGSTPLGSPDWSPLLRPYWVDPTPASRSSSSGCGSAAVCPESWSSSAAAPGESAQEVEAERRAAPAATPSRKQRSKVASWDPRPPASPGLLLPTGRTSLHHPRSRCRTSPAPAERTDIHACTQQLHRTKMEDRSVIIDQQYYSRVVLLQQIKLTHGI